MISKEAFELARRLGELKSQEVFLWILRIKRINDAGLLQGITE
jgi:hypothetical protein